MPTLVQDFLAELVTSQHGPMVTAFLLKAQAVQKWSSQDIVALLEKTQELNFNPSMSNELKDGITKLCQNEGSHVKLVQAGQVVSNLAPYLTEEDWLQLGNKRSQVCQLEDTKCQAVALWMPEPQATTLHTMVAEFQAVFQSLEPNPAVPSLHTYPDNPATLPDDWTKKAYGSEEPGRIVHLALWKKKVPLRSTAAKLVAKSAAKAKAVPQAVEPAPHSVEPLLEQLLAKFAVDKAKKGDPASAAMSDSKPRAAPPLALPKPATPEQQVVLPAAEQPEPKQEEQPKPVTSKRPLEAYQAFAQGKGKGHKNGNTKKPECQSHGF